MKVFIEPKVEIVHFAKTDIIVTSPVCRCVECTTCPDGKDDCGCFDFNE